MEKEIYYSIFGENIPKSKMWTDINEITEVLELLSYNEHIIFIPDGGWLDLKGISQSHEEKCLELTESEVVFKPKSLTFEFIDDEFNWSYFRLETHNLKSAYNEKTDDVSRENVGELLNPLKYVDANYNDRLENDEQKSRHIVRVLKGAFIIFNKKTTYNTGVLENVGAQKFKEYILNEYNKTKN